MCEIREEICRKLRIVAREYPLNMKTVCVIGSDESIAQVGGHRYIYAPTVSIEKLSGCSFKAARCFEEA